MLGLASAYGVWWVVQREHKTKKIRRYVFLVGVMAVVTGGMIYPLMAGYSRVQGFQYEPRIDGALYVVQNYPDDWAAIEWLQANTSHDVSTILEAPGRSYNYEGRISTFTGLPTILGWSLHEAQWRGNYVEQGRRESDIATIYSTYDGQQALELLHKWGVEYVIVGQVERSYVEEFCGDPGHHCHPVGALRKFDMLLKPVFKQGSTTIYKVPDRPA